MPQWLVDVLLIAFVGGLLSFGIGTGTMPAPPWACYDRDEQRVLFWAVACFYVALLIAGVVALAGELL